VSFASTNQVYSQKFDLWENLQKIKPFVSKKEDADRVFSKRSKEHSTTAAGSELYEMKVGDIYIDISDGVCRKGDSNAPKGTVVGLSLHYNKKGIWKFKDFVQKYQIDLSKFNRTTEPNTEMLGEFVFYELPDGSLHFSTADDIYLYQISINGPVGYRDPRCKDSIPQNLN
jgi:hypothetical protein